MSETTEISEPETEELVEAGEAGSLQVPSAQMPATERGSVQPGSAGRTVIANAVIEAIAAAAAREIEGVSTLGERSLQRRIAERLGGSQGTQGIGVVAGQREAIVDIDIIVFYGSSIPDVVSQVRRGVYSRILELCGLVSKEINITISGIEFDSARSGQRALVE